MHYNTQYTQINKYTAQYTKLPSNTLSDYYNKKHCIKTLTHKNNTWDIIIF